MKPARQSIILEIIAQQEIENQKQLMDALAERGVSSTQATLSRDIKDLRLTKEAVAGGKYRYVSAVKSENTDFSDRLKKIFKESVISCDVAQNLFVLHTLPGLAPAACSTLDGMHIKELVGTIAGDDTAFLAMKDTEAALRLYREIEELL